VAEGVVEVELGQGREMGILTPLCTAEMTCEFWG
jgi:hypothetical protein